MLDKTPFNLQKSSGSVDKEPDSKRWRAKPEPVTIRVATHPIIGGDQVVLCQQLVGGEPHGGAVDGSRRELKKVMTRQCSPQNMMLDDFRGGVFEPDGNRGPNQERCIGSADFENSPPATFVAS